MNKQIKEFSDQCWEYRKYGPPWFDCEKFAELIVMECAKISEEYADGSMPMCISNAIKNRFGVQQ